ncbi:MAG: hypothetical protein LBB44_02830 [Endomicrobium sp.]|jgi:hypothetical protein|nr:hypothetical protein [Endomicrobium sp.]
MLILVLVITVFIFKWQLSYKQGKIDELNFKQNPREILRDNLQSQISIRQNEISIVKRDKKEGVLVKRSYLPQESKVLVSTRKDGKVEIKSQSKGVCMRLNAGVVYTDDGYAGIGLKFFYWGRWGCEAGLNFNNFKIKPFICLSRNMSDMCKILKNTSIGITYDDNIGFRVSVSL